MPKRLLFVDDEPMLLQGLRRALHSMRQEWEMNFVESGAAALEALARDPYVAVITDMRMPLMDGAELLEQVKRRYPDVVRMVLSGQSSKESVLRSIAPAHQYMAKPCDPEELKMRLAQAFAMRDLLSNPAVKAVVAGLKSVPSLPLLYDELMAELQSEKSSLARIGKIISTDVGMTAKILQLANSAFIGLRCQVSNPEHAVSLIGIDTVRTLVLSVHVFSQYEAHTEVASHLPVLWKHSVEVASLAQRIATSEGCSKSAKEEAFTAGLLHDMGRIVLLAEMPAQYRSILDRQEAEGGDRLSLEVEILGCTHAQLGAYLMGIWGLPDPLVHAVAFHHSPAAAGEKKLSAVLAVHAADAIASTGSPSPINQDIQLDQALLSELGLQEKQAVWRSFHEAHVKRKSEEGFL
jgi:HD-like signal output (HDOD) protein